MLGELLRIEVACDEPSSASAVVPVIRVRVDEPFASLGRLRRAVVLREPLDDVAPRA